MASQETSASERALGAVRRRMRWQAAARGAAALAVAAAATVLVGVYLRALGAIGERGFACAVGVGVALILSGAIAAAARALPLRKVAKLVDDTHRLADRFGVALEFRDEKTPTPMMLAAIADAEAYAHKVRAKLASPWRRPPHLAVIGLCAALAIAVHFLQFPVAAAIVQEAGKQIPGLVLDRDQLEPERELIAGIKREAMATDDDELGRLADELQKLLDQKDLTRKELFEKLAELEQKALAGDRADQGWEELKQKLRKAGEQLGDGSLAKEAADALKKDDLERAKKELEELAKKLDQNQLDPKEQEKLAKALEQAAREQMKTDAEQKNEREIQKLEQEQRRLKRDQEKQANQKNEEQQRRLQKNERQLQQLKREQQRQQNAQRQLQRLQRQMQSAASQMRDGGGQQQQNAGQSMRNAANELGKMQDEIRKLGNSQATQSAIAQLREALRRMPQNGQGGQGQSVTILDGNQQPGPHGDHGSNDGQQGQNGQKGQNGQNGKNGPKGEKMRDFLTRAGGKGGDGKDMIFMPGQNGGDGKDQLLLPMGEGGQQNGPGGQGHDMPGLSSDGIGDSHDPNLHGEATQLAAKRQLSRVQGKMGAGPSKSETILGSAEKGFATANYRRVYGDYTSVVEEVMSKEQVPPGYRYYVKRYFQLIKPRE
jgi:chemotaxis protein histidine kinase CheA